MAATIVSTMYLNTCLPLWVSMNMHHLQRVLCSKHPCHSFSAMLTSPDEQMSVKEYVSRNWVHQLLPTHHIKEFVILIKVCHPPRT
jgi:hypothetical protein